MPRKKRRNFRNLPLLRQNFPGSSRKKIRPGQRKLENDLKKTEKSIARLEERDKEIDSFMEQEEVFTDVARCTELSREKAELSEKLETLYETWETLSEALAAQP